MTDAIETRLGIIKQSPRQADVSDVEWLCDEIEALRTALRNISRMKAHPDKVVVLATLAAAINIATQALSRD